MACAAMFISMSAALGIKFVRGEVEDWELIK